MRFMLRGQHAAADSWPTNLSICEQEYRTRHCRRQIKPSDMCPVGTGLSRECKLTLRTLPLLAGGQGWQGGPQGQYMGPGGPQHQPAALPDNRRVGTVSGPTAALEWAYTMQ